MPNWAELHELSVTEKATHKEVRYQVDTPNFDRCGNCRNYIDDSGASRCRTVECPIDASGWCVRYTPD
jgi:hypothetical protein